MALLLHRQAELAVKHVRALNRELERTPNATAKATAAVGDLAKAASGIQGANAGADVGGMPEWSGSPNNGGSDFIDQPWFVPGSGKTKPDPTPGPSGGRGKGGFAANASTAQLIVDTLSGVVDPIPGYRINGPEFVIAFGSWKMFGTKAPVQALRIVLSWALTFLADKTFQGGAGTGETNQIVGGGNTIGGQRVTPPRNGLLPNPPTTAPGNGITDAGFANGVRAIVQAVENLNRTVRSDGGLAVRTGKVS